MDPVRWTSAARAAIDPRRDAARVPRAKPVDLEALEARVESAVRDALDGLQEPSRGAGIDAVARGLRGTYLPTYRALLDGTPSDDLPRAPPVEVQAAAATALLAQMHTTARFDDLVAWWCARHGVAFAVDALLRHRRIGCRFFPGTARYGLVRHGPRETKTQLGGDELKGLRRLRRALAVVDRDAFDAARALAAGHREGADLATRCVAAFLFPDEPWGALDARDVTAHGDPPALAALLLATPLDADVAAALARRCDADLAAALATTVVHLHGARAAKPLAVVAERALDGRRLCLRALALVETEDAARALARHLEDEASREVTAPYFEKLPPATALAALGDAPGAHARSLALRLAADAKLAPPASPGLPERIAWTPAARALVAPRRGLGLAPPDLDRAEIAARLVDAFKSVAHHWQAGDARADADGRALVAGVFAQVATRRAVLARARLDPGLEAVAAAMMARSSWLAGALVGAWVAWEGVPFALRALADSLRYTVRDTFHGGVDAFWLVATPDETPPQIELAALLRPHVAALPDAAYDEARAVAAALREGARLALRCLLSAAFTDEPAWAADDARRWLALPHDRAPTYGPPLLASLRDADLARAVVDRALGRYAFHEIDRHYHTLVDRLGWDAAPILGAALARASEAHAKAAAVDALCVMEGVAAARALAPALTGSHGSVLKTARAYLTGLPHVALGGLVPLVARGELPEDAASGLLPALARRHPQLATQIAGDLDAPSRALLDRWLGR